MVKRILTGKTSPVPLSTLVILAVVFVTGLGHAATKSPTEAIRETVTQIIQVLEDPSLQVTEKAEERRRRLALVIGERFNYDQFAGRVLGRYWRLLGSDARQQFVKAFTRFLWSAYADRLDRAIDDYYTGKERVRYLGERIEEGYAEVRTVVVVPKLKRDLSIDYRMLDQTGEWQVYDIIVEGVSLVKNFRSQVARLLRSMSFVQLLETFERKSDHLLAPDEQEEPPEP